MRQDVLIAAALSFVLVACAPEAQEEAAPEAREDPAAAMTEEPAVGLGDEAPDEHLVYRPGDIDWRPAPAALEPGAEITVLEGDPAEAGVFTMRLRLPDGFTIAPHWHPNVERVTVVTGTFNLGSGEEFDPEAVEPLGPGSYTSLPPETRHFVVAEGETVIQITTIGPWELNYVNPDDDPRLRE